MTVKTYERIGDLISEIRRCKSIIETNIIIENDAYNELDALLKDNNLERIELEDIKSNNGRRHYDQC